MSLSAYTNFFKECEGTTPEIPEIQKLNTILATCPISIVELKKILKKVLKVRL